jgi:hypothetical protein
MFTNLEGILEQNGINMEDVLSTWINTTGTEWNHKNRMVSQRKKSY